MPKARMNRTVRPSCNSIIASFDDYLSRDDKRLIERRLREAARSIPEGDWTINPIRKLPGGIYLDPGYLDAPKEGYPWIRHMPSMYWTVEGLIIHGGWRPYRDAMVLEAQTMGARIRDTGCDMRPVKGREPKPWTPQKAFGA